MMSIFEALNLGYSEIVSFVGGGGKTTSIRLLLQELKLQGKKNLVTTTTHMYPNGCTISDDNEDRLFGVLNSIPDEYFPLMCGSSIDRNGKLCGLKSEFIKRLKDSKIFPYILVEADGSKGKPIKAFGSHEPVVPECTTLYCAVTGLDCLGLKLNSENAHRAELVSSITGTPVNSEITEEMVIELFRNRGGLLRGSSESCRKVVILNKADDKERVERGLRIGKGILEGCPGVERIVILSNTTEKNFYRAIER